MKISSVHIGGWFQRTMLQLSEVYDFLRNGESQLKLSKKKLAELHKSLNIGSIEYGVAGEEFVSFMTSELKRGFTAGFLLYIPFLLIDIVVSSTLMSMGMMMLPPAMISMPFKLLLFVTVDGWELLFSTIVNSFRMSG